MDWFVAAICLSCYFLFRLISSGVRKLGLKQLYKAISDKLNLSFQKGGFRFPPALVGENDGFPVRIEHPYWRPSLNRYIVDVKKQDPSILFFNFTLKPQKGMDKVDKAMYRSFIRTGDRAFDSLLDIEGQDPTRVMALLNREARELTGHLAVTAYRGKFLIARNSITTTVENWDLAGVTAKLLRLAALLTRPGNTADYLKANFYDTGEMTIIRRKNLELLLTRFPDIPDKQEVCNRALAEQDPEIRFLGLKSSLEKVDIKILESLWQASSKELLVRLCRLLPKHEEYRNFIQEKYPICSNSLKLIILEAIAATGRPEFNDFLVAQLSYPAMKLQRAVITALAACGTVTAVEQLFNITNPLLKPAAREAMAMIQSRLGTAGNGWLSLAENTPVDGALSLTTGSLEGSLALDPESEEKN